MARLAEAQRRTEERVDRLEQAIERLAEAQRRTEERVEQLARMVGELQNAFGSTVEEEAESMLDFVLRQKGYRILRPPMNLTLDGEIDVVIEAETPEGQRVWALIEAKARLSRRQVRTWAQRMRSAGWHRRLAEQGVQGPFLVYVYGIRIDHSAYEAAKEYGIGIITSQGERLAPKGLIYPVTNGE